MSMVIDGGPSPAAGRGSAAFGIKNDENHKRINLETDLSTLDEKDVGSGNCQLKIDKESGRIQKGNKVAAIVGTQMLLNLLRGESNTKIYLKIGGEL